jgi:chloramphenicol-sensitive protein RarD
MKSERIGVIFALLTYFLWGVLPLFWKLLSGIDPLVVLAHRVVWSAVFLVLAQSYRSSVATAFARLRSPIYFTKTVFSALAISANWGIYIWAVSRGLVTECSLGYFMSPIGFALLGILLFEERASALRYLSIAIAAAGVALRIIEDGKLEPVSLLLMLTMCLYGLAKKGRSEPASESVLLETVVLIPLAVMFLGYRIVSVSPGMGVAAAFGSNLQELSLLILAGPLTAVPLMFFGEAIRRISLTTQGIVQYLSPTLQFVLAVFVFQEPWSPSKLAVFGLVWLSVAVYLADLILTRRLYGTPKAGLNQNDAANDGTNGIGHSGRCLAISD